MLRKPSPLQIDPDAPWANDDFGRQPQAELLSRFLADLSGTFVIALRAPWGAGKTVFLKRLAAHLEKQRIPVVQVDAWRSDYLDDPLLAYVAAVRERLDKLPRAEAKRSAGEVVSGLARQGTKLIVPVATLIASAVLPGSAEAIKSLAENTAAIADELLKWQQEQEGALRGFRQQLEAARDLLTDGSPGPLVFLVDELDRCRPDFAIKALERIKHFFDVERVVFIVATDGYNLPAAVAALYGERMDGERYLRKFFDYEFRLADPKPADLIRVLAESYRLADLLPEGLTFAQATEHWHSPVPNLFQGPTLRAADAVEIIETFPGVATAFDLSIRDQIQAFTMLSATLRAAPAERELFPAVLVCCTALRFAAPKIYELLINGQTDITQIFPEGSTYATDLRDTQARRNWFDSSNAAETCRVLAPVVGARQVHRLEHIENLLKRGQSHDRRAALARLGMRLQHVDDPDLNVYLRDNLRLAEAFAPPPIQGQLNATLGLTGRASASTRPV